MEGVERTSWMHFKTLSSLKDFTMKYLVSAVAVYISLVDLFEKDLMSFVDI